MGAWRIICVAIAIAGNGCSAHAADLNWYQSTNHDIYLTASGVVNGQPGTCVPGVFQSPLSQIAHQYVSIQSCTGSPIPNADAYFSLTFDSGGLVAYHNADASSSAGSYSTGGLMMRGATFDVTDPAGVIVSFRLIWNHSRTAGTPNYSTFAGIADPLGHFYVKACGGICAGNIDTDEEPAPNGDETRVLSLGPGTYVVWWDQQVGTSPSLDGFQHSDGTLSIEVLPDTDNDGIYDRVDNCTTVANPNQCDSDFDGYGNACDGDLNNNAATNAQDTSLFRQQLGQPSPGPTYNKADLNCNGAVNGQDTTLFRQRLGSPPGPSGLACAGTIPCW